MSEDIREPASASARARRPRSCVSSPRATASLSMTGISMHWRRFSPRWPTFRSRDGVMDATGREAVLDQFRGRFSALGPTNHVAHEQVCTFGADTDCARGIVTSDAEVRRNGRAFIAAMRYEDTYRREQGRWRFVDRLLWFFYYLPVDEYAKGLGERLRVRVYGDQRPADFPEPLPSWRLYHRSGQARSESLSGRRSTRPGSGRRRPSHLADCCNMYSVHDDASLRMLLDRRLLTHFECARSVSPGCTGSGEPHVVPANAADPGDVVRDLVIEPAPDRHRVDARSDEPAEYRPLSPACGSTWKYCGS